MTQMIVFYIIVFLVTLVIPIVLMFLRDTNLKRKKVLNLLLIITMVLLYLPLVLAYFIDMTYHWLMLATIPIGGVILIALCVLKIVFHVNSKSV